MWLERHEQTVAGEFGRKRHDKGSGYHLRKIVLGRFLPLYEGIFSEGVLEAENMVANTGPPSHG